MRAYARNRNIIKINIHNLKNRRRNKHVETIKKPINEKIKPTTSRSCFNEASTATPNNNKNIARQNDLNQKILQQLFNTNKSDESSR